MKYSLIKTRHTYVLLFLFQLLFINYFVKYATMGRMERTVVRRVNSVSTTPSVTMSTVAVYRGVVLGIRETSVLKVWYIWCDEGKLTMGVVVIRLSALS